MLIEGLKTGITDLIDKLQALEESVDFNSIYDTVDLLFVELQHYIRRYGMLGPVILIQDPEIQQEMDDFSILLMRGRKIVQDAMNKASITADDLDLVQELDRLFEQNANKFMHLYEYDRSGEEVSVKGSPWWSILVEFGDKFSDEAKNIPIEDYLHLFWTEWHPDAKLLEAYAEDRLCEARRKVVDLHLERCSECRARLKAEEIAREEDF